MASLVADYTDSENEEEREVKIKTEIEEITVKQEPSKKSLNFFDAAEYESDEDKKVTVKTETIEKLPNVLQTEKLPSIIEAAKSRLGTSVFANPFEEAEQAKNQILEKHVKLTQAAPRKPPHQPVCWKFKKGKCHMGKNCRFFHDPESRTIPDSPTPQEDSLFSGSQQPVYHPTAFSDCHTGTFEEEEDDDSYLASMRKKKRYGVSDHLVPPKKAFESLQRQREKERPWTLESSHLE